MNWISVEDELPEHDFVLVHDINAGSFVSLYVPGKCSFFEWNVATEMYDVRVFPYHWMPLPEPPEPA